MLDDDPIAVLTRLRQDTNAGPGEILPVLQALRDLAFGALDGQRQQIRIGRATLGDAVPILRDFLRDADIEVVEWACRVLGLVGARECLPDLLDLLRPEAREERTLTAVFPFGDRRSSYPDESAMHALRLMRAIETVPDIVRCLVSENERTRCTAGVTLQGMDAAPQVALVLAHPDARLRGAALQFLTSAAIKTSLRPELEAALLTVLREEEPDVRLSAVQVLARQASVGAVLPLIESLDWVDGDEQLEATTLAAIAQIQARQPAAAPGQVSVLGAASGQVSVLEAPGGAISLADTPAEDDE